MMIIIIYPHQCIIIAHTLQDVTQTHSRYREVEEGGGRNKCPEARNSDTHFATVDGFRSAVPSSPSKKDDQMEKKQSNEPWCRRFRWGGPLGYRTRSSQKSLRICLVPGRPPRRSLRTIKKTWKKKQDSIVQGWTTEFPGACPAVRRRLRPERYPHFPLVHEVKATRASGAVSRPKPGLIYRLQINGEAVPGVAQIQAPEKRPWQWRPAIAVVGIES